MNEACLKHKGLLRTVRARVALTTAPTWAGPDGRRELLAPADTALTGRCESPMTVKQLVPFHNTRHASTSCTSPARVCSHWRWSSVCSGRRRSVRLTPPGLPAAPVTLRSSSSQPPTSRSVGAAVSDGGRCATSCHAWSVPCAPPPAGPALRERGFGPRARTMTGSRADRRDRTLAEIAAGRPRVAPAVIRVADRSKRPRFREGFHDHKPEKRRSPSTERRPTSSGRAPASSRCRSPTSGGCPARTVALQAAAR